MVDRWQYKAQVPRTTSHGRSEEAKQDTMGHEFHYLHASISPAVGESDSTRIYDRSAINRLSGPRLPDTITIPCMTFRWVFADGVHGMLTNL